jgi:hypothetical protein
MFIEPHTYWSIIGKNCEITIENRPAYCDRGNVIAKIHPEFPLIIDWAEGWPRYYFDLRVAIQEIKAWLEKRQAFINLDIIIKDINGTSKGVLHV